MNDLVDIATSLEEGDQVVLNRAPPEGRLPVN